MAALTGLSGSNFIGSKKMFIISKKNITTLGEILSPKKKLND